RAGVPTGRPGARPFNRVSGRLVSALSRSGSNRAPPVVVRLPHIGIAKLDPQRPARRAQAVPIGLEVDPAKNNRQRNPVFGPLSNQLEARANDAHEVTAVDTRQVLLDLAAVVAEVLRRHATT